MKKSKKEEKSKAVERLHEDYRRKLKEEEEWIRIQTTGGGAET
jgi:hypothetical protein